MIGMQSEQQVFPPLDHGQLSRHTDPFLLHIKMKRLHEYHGNNHRRHFRNPAHAVRNFQNGTAPSSDRDQETPGFLNTAVTELLEKCVLPFRKNRSALRR